MTSFTDLLSGNDNMDSSMAHSWGYSDQKTDRIGDELPKFKSLQPPSLPFSPAPVSPSSYFAISPGFSPTDFFSSPLFPSHFSVSYIVIHDIYMYICIFLYKIIDGFFLFCYFYAESCISNYWGFCW